MLFVMEPKQLSKRDTLLLHVIPTLLVFVAFMGVTLWSAYSARNDLRKEQQRIVGQTLRTTEKSFSDRMAIYEEILRGGQALFNSSTEVTREDWHSFSNTFNVTNQYAGFVGIGYYQSVPKEELAPYVAHMQASGLPNFSVKPTGDRDVYVPITYFEPQTESNKAIIGFDVATNAVRKQAVEAARDGNKPVLSAKVNVIDESGDSNEPGIIMFLPVYKHNFPTTTVEERRRAISGYIAAPFRGGQLFNDIFGPLIADSPNVGIQIYNGDVKPENLLYENSAYKNITKSLDNSPQSRLNLYNQNFTILYKISPDIIGRTIQNRPINTLFGGLLFSAILAGLVLVLLISRTRSLAYAEQQEVQQAKDDLLSLASHQLRTPATGVKQYIGMLRQGYAGKISNLQKDLLDKAYMSNERQLGIIDEILHVARIDTGRITLNIETVNLSKLIREVMHEQRENFKRKKQAGRMKLPKKDITLQADPQYLQMAIENLINNASKYTHEGGKIQIRLAQKRGLITLEVADNGVGIAAEDRHMLFKKFSRIHNELTRQTEGSGIGLYITQKIIGLHGGSIDVESEPDKGAIFIVTLPKKPSITNQVV